MGDRQGSETERGGLFTLTSLHVLRLFSYSLCVGIVPATFVSQLRSITRQQIVCFVERRVVSVYAPCSLILCLCRRRRRGVVTSGIFVGVTSFLGTGSCRQLAKAQ